MKKQIRVIWAGAWVLLMVAGCSAMDLTGFFALQGTDYARDRVVTGSLEAAVQSTKLSLEYLGMAAKVTQDGETVKIASQTPTGGHFTVLLSRDKGDASRLVGVTPVEKTRIHLEWNGNADDQTGVKILAQIESNRRAKAEQ
jgi:hypothetical protein